MGYPSRGQNPKAQVLEVDNNFPVIGSSLLCTEYFGLGSLASARVVARRYELSNIGFDKLQAQERLFVSMFLALLGYCIWKSLGPELVRFLFHFNPSWFSVVSWLDDQRESRVPG